MEKDFCRNKIEIIKVYVLKIMFIIFKDLSKSFFRGF